MPSVVTLGPLLVPLDKGPQVRGTLEQLNVLPLVELLGVVGRDIVVPVPIEVYCVVRFLLKELEGDLQSIPRIC